MFPGIDYDDWDLPIQAGSGLAHVRPVRDAIRLKMERLLTELTPVPERGTRSSLDRRSAI